MGSGRANLAYISRIRRYADHRLMSSSGDRVPCRANEECRPMEKRERAYWVVSPNVRYSARSVSAWRQASVEFGAAFMGWSPDNPEHSRIGPKFAGKVPGGIEPADVILIAPPS